MPKPLIFTLFPKQGTSLPSVWEWGGEHSRSMVAGGKSNDRLENWGIRATWTWNPTAGVYQAVQTRALCESQPSVAQAIPRKGKKPTASLLVPEGAEIKAGGCCFIAAFIWGSYWNVPWGYLTGLKQYHSYQLGAKIMSSNPLILWLKIPKA